MIKGLVLLIAVGVDVYSKRQGRPSIIGILLRNRKGAGLDEPAATPAAPAGTQTPVPTDGAQETNRPADLTPEGK
jgi:putative multiple sugar transport system permease protein